MFTRVSTSTTTVSTNTTTSILGLEEKGVAPLVWPLTAQQHPPHNLPPHLSTLSLTCNRLPNSALALLAFVCGGTVHKRKHSNGINSTAALMRRPTPLSGKHITCRPQLYLAAPKQAPGKHRPVAAINTHHTLTDVCRHSIAAVACR